MVFWAKREFVEPLLLFLDELESYFNIILEIRFIHNKCIQFWYESLLIKIKQQFKFRFFDLDQFCRNSNYYSPSRFSPRLSFSRLLRVVNTCTTRGPRDEYAWNKRFKQTVINDVFNKRFKRFNYFKRKNRGRLWN